VILDKDANVYGTTTGSLNGGGVVFKLTAASGYSETILQTISGVPFGGLVAIGHNLYGASFSGGGSGPGCNGDCGTVFTVSESGTGYAVVHDFHGSDGGNPYCTLATDGQALYGTTVNGGAYADGVVFRYFP
jgi:uncharacterized repeat protein (TIGR03803 family)